VLEDLGRQDDVEGAGVDGHRSIRAQFKRRVRITRQVGGHELRGLREEGAVRGVGAPVVQDPGVRAYIEAPGQRFEPFGKRADDVSEPIPRLGAAQVGGPIGVEPWRVLARLASAGRLAHSLTRVGGLRGPWRGAPCEEAGDRTRRWP
jgi:hypothetical protein